MSIRLLVVFVVALGAVAAQTSRPSAPSGVKATLSSPRASVAAFETLRLTLTVSLADDAQPLLGLRRSDLVREKCVVAAGPDRRGRWTVCETAAADGALDLLPGESFGVSFVVRLPDGFGVGVDAPLMLQWVGAGSLAALRSNELTTVVRDARNPVATLHTSEGDVVVELWPSHAPNHVANFVSLAEKGFYDGRLWHRVVPNFVVQTGCPKGDGTGDPGYRLPAEFNDQPFVKGVLGMARGGEPDSAGSQFFICVADAPSLNKQYTAFGRVLEGQDVADRISNLPRDPARERPLTDVTVRKVVVSKPADYVLPEVKKA
ncbi:MAG TPA: peptidylprolyl isomerase [Planctomycetota bacterium]|nr:peptidylprolyl isomerase [Planctomycetota bacterium]